MKTSLPCLWREFAGRLLKGRVRLKERPRLGRAGLLVRVFAVMIAAAIGTPALNAQQVEGYSHRHWDVEEGAPSDIWAIAQTRDGFLWLGTSNGLYRFDGLVFEKIEPDTYQRWQSNRITALAAAPDGALWVGYDYGGVAVFRGGRLVEANAAPRPRGSVAAIAIGRDGDVWVSVQSNYGPELRRWYDGRWQVFDKTSWLGDQPLQSVFVASDGALWIARYPDILRLPPGASEPERIAARTGYSTSFAQDGNGYVWLLSSLGLQRLSGPGNPGLRAADRQAGGIYGQRSLLFDDGMAWIAGGELGITRQALDGPGPRMEQVVRVHSRALFRDREGTIWGGGSDGLVNYVRSPLVALSLKPAAITGFAIDRGKGLLVGTETGIYRVADGTPELILKHPNVNAICSGPNMLMAVFADGIRLQRSGSWSKLPDPGNRFVSAGCAIDEARNVWTASGSRGIYRLTGTSWTQENGWPGATVLVSDGVGKLYASRSLSKVSLVGPGINRTLWQGDDIAVGYVKLIKRIGRYVYLGGEKGLARYDGVRFETLEARNHPWLSGIAGIAIRNADAWVVTSIGIVRIRATDLSQAFAAPRKPLAHELVGTGLGVAARSNGYMSNDAELDAHGQLWFVTNRGIFRLDPTRIKTNPVPPPVSIRGMVANGVRYEQPFATLPPGTSRILFDYVGLSLIDAVSNSYRYRLEGVDASWIDAGAKRQASYTGLGPGKYRFQVIAANSDGVWNRTGASMTIVIKPFFWQTLWFKAALGLLAVVLLSAFVRWKIHTTAEVTRRRIEDRLAVREHIAQDLHDTLLQGFQGLVLRFQSIVDRLPRGNATRAELESTLDRADDVLQDARNRVRYLRERTEPVDLGPMLSKIADEVLDGHLAWSVSEVGRGCTVCAPVAEDIDRIVNEALFNALRHARARKVTIRVFYDPASVTISIADDGDGIEEGVKRLGQRDGHYGLVGMRERAGRLGATFETLDGTPTGTEIRLTIPARVAFR